MGLNNFTQEQGNTDSTVTFRCFRCLDYLGACDLNVILIDSPSFRLNPSFANIWETEGEWYVARQLGMLFTNLDDEDGG